jgi:hypothetical protein
MVIERAAPVFAWSFGAGRENIGAVKFYAVIGAD